jgi:hypothetical protein
MNSKEKYYYISAFSFICVYTFTPFAFSDATLFTFTLIVKTREFKVKNVGYKVWPTRPSSSNSSLAKEEIRPVT